MGVSKFNVVSPKVGHGKGSRISYLDCLDFKEPIFKTSGHKLPHWDQEGKLQYVTLRLVDSLPQSELARLDLLKNQILNEDYLLALENPMKYIEEINYWLDLGYGNCILQYDGIQSIVDNALNFYDGKRWDLYDYVIMPNHVHFIAIPYQPLEEIMSMLIRFTTRNINEMLDREGRIWQKDFFDRIIRSVVDYHQKAQYIRQNPEGWFHA